MTTLLDEALRALRECADDLISAVIREFDCRGVMQQGLSKDDIAAREAYFGPARRAREVLARADAQKDEDIGDQP